MRRGLLLDGLGEERVELCTELDEQQREFIDFVLAQYIHLGVDELQQERLPQLLSLKYHSQKDGIEALGGTQRARATFIEFQKALYQDILVATAGVGNAKLSQ